MFVISVIMTGANRALRSPICAFTCDHSSVASLISAWSRFNARRGTKQIKAREPTMVEESTVDEILTVDQVCSNRNSNHMPAQRPSPGAARRCPLRYPNS